LAALLAIAVAVLLLSLAGMRSLRAYVAKALNDVPIGRLEYESLNVTAEGLDLIKPRLLRSDDGSLFAEAAKISLKLPLRDLLRNRAVIKSLNAEVISLRIYPRFEENGEWDIERILRKLPKDKISSLDYVKVNLSDAKVVVNFDEPGRARFKSWLNGLASKQRVDASNNFLALLKKNEIVLTSPFDEELLVKLLQQVELVPPASLEIAFEGGVTAQPQAKAYEARLSITSPFTAEVKIGDTGRADMVTASIRADSIPLASLGVASSDPAVLDISKAVVEQVSFSFTIAGGKLAIDKATARMSKVTFAPGTEHEITLADLRLGTDKDGLVTKLRLDAGGADINMRFASMGAFSYEAKDLRLNPYIASIRGFTAKETVATLRSGEETGEVSGKLALSGMSLRGKVLAGNVSLSGSAKGDSFSGNLEWSANGRRLASLKLSGSPARIRADGTLSLRRSDMPASLIPVQLPSEFTSADVTLSGFIYPKTMSFDGRSQRVRVRLASGTLAGGTVFIQASPKSFHITSPMLEFTPAKHIAVSGMNLGRLKLTASVDAKGSFAHSGITLNASASGKALIGKDKLHFRMKGGGPAGKWVFSANTGGVFRDDALAASAIAKFAGDRIDFSAIEFAYAATSLDGSGFINTRTNRFQLVFNAESFPLRKWLPNVTAIDKTTLGGIAKGKLDDPSLELALFTNKLVFNAQGREVALRRIHAQCIYGKGVLKILQAAASIGGEFIFANGELGKERFGVMLWGDSVSLPVIAAQLVPEVQIAATGDGRLRARIYGTYKEPQLTFAYTQKGGTIAEEQVGTLDLEAEASLDRVTVQKALLTMGGGVIEGSGELLLRGRGENSWSVKATDFPVIALGRLTPELRRLNISGLASGQANGAGTAAEPVIQGTLSLRDGRILGAPLDKLELSFNTRPDGVFIDNFTAYNSDSIVTASGFWGRRAEDTLINLEIPNLDISLLSALMPPEFQPMSGEAGMSLVVTQGDSGKPELAGSFQSSGSEGLHAGPFSAERVSGKLSIVGRTLKLQEATVQTNGSQLIVNGDLPLPGYPGSLDLAVHAKDFALETMLPFFKNKDLLFAGKLTTELQVKGTFARPLVSGTVRSEINNVSYRGNALNATIIAYAMLEDSDIPAVMVKLFPGAAADPTTQTNYAQLSGSASLSPDGKNLDFIKLGADFNNLSYVEVKGLFKGGLSGYLEINKAGDPQPISITGDVSVKPGSTIQLPGMDKVKPVPFAEKTLLQINLEVMPDAWVRYTPRMMEVALQGNLTLTGSVDDPKVDGSFIASRGSLVLLNRIVRLTEPATIVLRPEYGLTPHLFGTAAVELPGVLETSSQNSAVEILPSDIPLSPSSDDLTIYFGFHDVPLDAMMDEENLDAMDMYSVPPLARDTLLVYLIGGQGLSFSRSGLRTFLGSEALAFSGSRLSRYLEESLNFKRFEIRALPGSEGTPFYLNIEKEITPDLTISYLRTFLEPVDEREELGARYYFYQVLGSKSRNAYVEIIWRKRGPVQEEAVANIGFNFKF
jgi:hypothetical protein